MPHHSGADTPMTTLAEQLRQATRASHQQLDRHPLLRPLIQPGISRAAYAAALAALHGPMSYLEGLIEQLLQGMAEPPPYALRCATLSEDLNQLQRQPWPYRGPIIALENRAQMIGALYVLEGSRLGGFAIAKRLRQDSPELPRRFFDSGGQPNWPAYWQPLLASVDDSEQAEGVLGALKGFAVFIDHLEALEPSAEPAHPD
jgi:heme oxygenase